EKGREEVQKLYLDDGVYIEARGTSFESGLHVAALKGNFKVVDWILNRGTNINTRDSGGRTALHLADEVRMAEHLLDYGADVDTKDNAGSTALHLAAGDKGKRSVVELLLDRGANFELEDDVGRKACHIALENNNLVAVFLILNGKC
ncbi:ankyrin repeat-containing domain protein, partial [Trichophaea hybrida]